MKPLAFVVVTFDDNDGPVIAQTVPSDVELSAAERDAVRFHALPDSSVVGDVQYSFRIAAEAMRASEGAQQTDNDQAGGMRVDAAHLFGHVFFRLTRDASLRRGAWSASVVLLVRYPFVALYKRVMALVGTAFFNNSGGAARAGNVELLDAAFRDMSSWPAPRLAHEYELPLLGHALMFRAPPVRGVAHILDAEHTALAAFACASPISNLDSINVYESFSTMVSSLWLLWELTLTGSPILVYGTDAGHASDAVYAALSLIAPLEFGGEVQPYFIVQDSAFAAFSSAPKGGPLPAAVIGTSNPFFLQALSHWPNVLSVGEIDDGDGAHQHASQRRSSAQLNQRHSPSSNRVRSLNGREGVRISQTLVSSRSATLTAPRAVLDKLLDPRNVLPRAPLARVDSWERVSAKPSDSPAVAASSAPSTPTAKPTAVASAIASASSALSSVSSLFRRAPAPASAPATPAAAASSSSWLPSISIKLGSVSISINDDEPKDAPTPPAPVDPPVQPAEVALAPALVALPVDANVLPEIVDEPAPAPAPAPTTPAEAVPVAAAATSPPSPQQLPPTSVSVWSTALTSSLASAAETAAQMAAVPQRMISDAIWPKEQPRVPAEALVQHNNAVLRSHFLQLTNSFLAPFESFVLTMVRRGKVASFSEKEFLEFVRTQRPLREYTARDLAVLDLYQRFCRSVNFHVWLTARLDAATAGLNAKQ